MRLFTVSIALSLTIACQGTEASDTELDTDPLASLESGWNEIPGGEGTTCARGDEFSFFVRPGDPEKVVVDFMGGGACWSEESCSYAGAIFADDMDWMRALLEADDYDGIYDAVNEADNPIADWTHVIVPYCTGDIHWGDASVTYGEGDDAFTIEHKGQVNTRDVLAWMQDNVPAPAEVFVTGCSAGAYGAIGWTPHIAEQYPSARITQLGDSGAGIIVDDWFLQTFPVWQSESAMPYWIDDLDPAQVDYSQMALPDLYAGIGAYYPDMQLGQFNTLADATQVFYYEAMGGSSDASEWTSQMLAYDSWLQADLANYTSYLASGSDHCILPYDTTYTVETAGVPFTSWVADHLEHQAEDIACDDCR